MSDMPTLSQVLDEDGDLAEAVPLDYRQQAIKECAARTVLIPAGRWNGTQMPLPGEGIGMLVLSGLLIRRVGIHARYGAELLGQGDILRPWEGHDELQTLPVTTVWRVVRPARMAVLDEAFARRLAHYPQLTGRLIKRTVERTRKLAVNMAIVHQTRVDVRLHMLFWHLAARWGRVRGDGVVLPLPLSHTVLAELSAARRPTVSSALSELAKRKLVRATDSGWLLTGEPPGELLDPAAVPASPRQPHARSR
jgi:CRP-like cAMP-binding protein